MGVRESFTAITVLVALVLLGRAAQEPTHPVVRTVSGTVSTLTDDEVTKATTAAGREIRRLNGHVASATVLSVPGRVDRSNTGIDCDSGWLLRVTLIGSFDTVTTGHPGASGRSGASPDLTVRVVVLTVDAESGATCLVGVRTGNVVQNPGATVLELG